MIDNGLTNVSVLLNHSEIDVLKSTGCETYSTALLFIIRQYARDNHIPVLSGKEGLR